MELRYVIETVLLLSLEEMSVRDLEMKRENAMRDRVQVCLLYIYQNGGNHGVFCAP